MPVPNRCLCMRAHGSSVVPPTGMLLLSCCRRRAAMAASPDIGRISWQLAVCFSSGWVGRQEPLCTVHKFVQGLKAEPRSCFQRLPQHFVGYQDLRQSSPSAAKAKRREAESASFFFFGRVSAGKRCVYRSNLPLTHARVRT